MKKLGKQERNPEKVEEWVEEIYAVLAVMPWSSRRGGGQFEALCEALWAARDGPLKEERILSSLLRPQCNDLVTAYCSTALRLQRDHLLRSTPNMQGIMSVLSSMKLSSSHNEVGAPTQHTVNVTLNGDFILGITFLEQITDLCLSCWT